MIISPKKLFSKKLTISEEIDVSRKNSASAPEEQDVYSLTHPHTFSLRRSDMFGLNIALRWSATVLENKAINIKLLAEL